jgi:tripartite-type tricarboxylate transporter receptor subunit TctC
MLHLPFNGTPPALIEIIAGRADMIFSTMAAALPSVQANRLRALAVSGAKRSRVLPELPTIAESALPGYDAVQWYGVLAPANTPREVIAKLHDAVTRTLRDTAVRDRFLADGADIVGSSPEEFGTYIASETAKWAKVIKSAGIKPE